MKFREGERRGPWFTAFDLENMTCNDGPWRARACLARDRTLAEAAPDVLYIRRTDFPHDVEAGVSPVVHSLVIM